MMAEWFFTAPAAGWVERPGAWHLISFTGWVGFLFNIGWEK